MGGEAASIARAQDVLGAPVTRARLAGDLRALGVEAGCVLLVHSSLSALGWVCGGAVAVVEALLDALGPDGTLVVPTHTSANSDPAGWSRPPVPEAWWPHIRERMPPFDPARTPSRGVGVVPEVVRTWPGSVRSAHPQVSFAALGPAAALVCADHVLESGLGERSPLARVEELGGSVLLLGAGHDANTSLHLAEGRVARPRRSRFGAAVRDGDAGGSGRRWVQWDDVEPDASDFAALGAAWDATGATRIGRVGAGEARLMRQPELVAFAVGWLEAHRYGAARA